MRHATIEQVNKIISIAFPKANKAEVFRFVDSGSANDDTHIVATDKATNKKYGIKATLNNSGEEFGARSEEMSYRVSEALGLGVVCPARHVTHHTLIELVNSGDAVVTQWANGKVYMNARRPDIADMPKFAMSLGRIAFFCWLLKMCDRHSLNAIVENNMILSIDNEDAFDYNYFGSYAYQSIHRFKMAPDEMEFIKLGYIEAADRFKQVSNRIAKIVESYGVQPCEHFHWNDSDIMVEKFCRKVDSYIENYEAPFFCP